MHQSKPLQKSTSTTEVSNVHLQVVRAQTPGPEERFTYAFKSLFTLADVAAKRRANGSVKKLMVKNDENQWGGGEAGGSSVSFKRSKSSGDVILGERVMNLASMADGLEKGAVTGRSGKGLRSRAATTPSTPPSKIPKAKSSSWIQNISNSPSSAADDVSSSSSSTSTNLSDVDPDALKIDDALFVMLTPPRTPDKQASKTLKLAAHAPSLPRIASPFSPRTNQQSPSKSPPRTVRPRTTPSFPATGHTSASLNLTKSHWELRYEAWILSLRTVPRRPAPVRTEDETPPRSRFPDPPTNPALFPRAGSLTPKALRPLLDGSVVEEDARPALELDWAMRAWPLDKIQRALFVHDMDVRAWFPVDEVSPERNSKGVGEPMETGGSELGLTRMSAAPEEDEREKERAVRRWEWDWEMRWRVIEGMAEEDGDRDRAECEYDVFLAEGEGDRAYGGCEMQREARRTVMEETDWEWSEDAMEVDTIM